MIEPTTRPAASARRRPMERLGSRLRRAQSAADRDLTAADRDHIAEARDKAGRDRDARAAELAEAALDSQASLEQQLELVRAQAAADRARAAADRERAAMDRANAARERARLEAELRSAHLDELTGVYRREMGRMALSHEIDRARPVGRSVRRRLRRRRRPQGRERPRRPCGRRSGAADRGSRDPLGSGRSIRSSAMAAMSSSSASAGPTSPRRRAGSTRSAVAIKADAEVGLSVGLAALDGGRDAGPADRARGCRHAQGQGQRTTRAHRGRAGARSAGAGPSSATSGGAQSSPAPRAAFQSARRARLEPIEPGEGRRLDLPPDAVANLPGKDPRPATTEPAGVGAAAAGRSGSRPGATRRGR